MQMNWQEILSWLPFLTIPFVTAFVGWITNVIAIKMTFYPVEYFGLRPFGWQGIVPSKAKKMAETAVDLWTSKLIDLEIEFSKIQPDRVAAEMAPAIDHLARQIIDEVMEAKMATLWKTVPESLKNDVYKKISDDLPSIVEHMMIDVKNNFNEMLDLKYLAVSALTQNKKLLNQVFLKCGAQEFKFIEKSGLYFGFLFGLIQMAVWYFYTFWWILPVFGVMVGYFTNYLALQLIFRPLKPIRIGGWQIQGLFIKRQNEVSQEYSSIVAAKIISIENIFEYIIRGPGQEKLTAIVQQRIENTIEETAGITKPVIELATGSKMFMYIRNIASFRFMQELPMNIRHVFGYAENALDLKKVLREKMIGLTPVEFEAFLRPVFKEDEFTLILVGAFLGGIAGLLQFLILF
jgi:uncharacterized membrane protein YheB (UPF0754 family)